MTASSPYASTLLIPAYDPDEQLAPLIRSLLSNGFSNIIVVDDGSKDKEVFESLISCYEVTVLTHSQNKGKGAALKTGFRYIIDQLSNKNIQSIISVDADGQHAPKDIAAIAEAAATAPQSLILGVRNFTTKVPLRSSFGNLLTRKILQFAENIDLEDTQTGLRAIPLRLAKETLNIDANGYEFELECLLLTNNLQIDIRQVPITTIYLNENASSHFRPIVDSMKIYAVFSRFIVISFASFLIDITAFTLAYSSTSDILLSTFFARAISAVVNFFGNKYVVFRSLGRREFISEALSYCLLVVCIATLSAFSVEYLSGLTQKNVVLIKVSVDLVLFCANFLLQKHVLFKAKS